MNPESEAHNSKPIPNLSHFFVPFPPLAVELVRHIFETAARKDKKTSLVLACLSKTVNKWITPIIYHTVIVQGVDHAYPFYITLQAHGETIGSSVRRLFIETGIKYPGAVAEVICYCPNLEFLVAKADMAHDAFVAGMGSPCPGPWHIMLFDPDSKIQPLDNMFLRNVTHLYIDSLNEGLVNSIQTLCRLKHLGFGCWGDSEPLEFLGWITRLLSSPSLAILFLQAFHDGIPTDKLFGAIWNQLADIEDKRLLAGPAHYESDYITLVETGGTIWDDAHARCHDWRGLVEE